MSDVPALSWVIALLFALAAFVVIAWVLIPLILLNINAYLRRILREQERMNRLLDERLPALRPPPRHE